MSADSQLEWVRSEMRDGIYNQCQCLCSGWRHTRNKDGAIFLFTYLREALPVAFTAPIFPTDVSAGFWLHRCRININLTAQASESIVDKAHARYAKVTKILESFNTSHDFTEDSSDHEKVLLRLRKVMDKTAALEIAKFQADTANGPATGVNAIMTGQKMDTAGKD